MHSGQDPTQLSFKIVKESLRRFLLLANNMQCAANMIQGVIIHSKLGAELGYIVCVVLTLEE